MNTTNSLVRPISLGMVNVFLIKGERPILVDAGNPGQKGKILEGLASYNVDPKDLSLILITHCHSDHVGSLAALKQHTDVKVAIHKNEAEALTNSQNARFEPPNAMGRMFNNIFPKNIAVPGVTPDVVIEQELDLAEFGVKGTVFHTPGHTLGSVSIILESGEAIIGDLVMGGILNPNIPKHYLGIFLDKQASRENIKCVLDRNPKKIYISHGGVLEPEAVRRKFDL